MTPVLLRIALRGDDRHYAGGASQYLRPAISVIVDLGGNDVYESAKDAYAFGAGVFGYGVCVDVEGDDRYIVNGKKSIGLGAGS